MEPAPSFAPLAAKLAAKAEEIRLADGERDGLAQVMALLMCALLLMLACLCEALDARAAALAARPLAAPAPREIAASLVPAPRALPGAVGRDARAPSGARARGPRHNPGPSRRPIRGHWTACPRRLQARVVARPRPDPGCPGSPLAVPSRNAAFPPAPTHARTITIS